MKTIPIHRSFVLDPVSKPSCVGRLSLLGYTKQVDFWLNERSGYVSL